MSHCWCKCEAGLGQCGPKVPKLKSLFNAHKQNDEYSLRRGDRQLELQQIWEEIGEDKQQRLEELREIVAEAVDKAYDKQLEETVRRRTALEESVAKSEQRLRDILGPEAYQNIAPKDLPLQTRLNQNLARLHEFDSAQMGGYGWVGGLVVLVELRRRIAMLRSTLKLPSSEAGGDLEEVFGGTMEALGASSSMEALVGPTPRSGSFSPGMPFTPIAGRGGDQEQKPMFQRLERFYKTLCTMENTWVESFAHKSVVQDGIQSRESNSDDEESDEESEEEVKSREEQRRLEYQLRHLPDASKAEVAVIQRLKELENRRQEAKELREARRLKKQMKSSSAAMKGSTVGGILTKEAGRSKKDSKNKIWKRSKEEESPPDMNNEQLGLMILKKLDDLQKLALSQEGQIAAASVSSVLPPSAVKPAKYINVGTCPMFWPPAALILDKEWKALIEPTGLAPHVPHPPAAVSSKMSAGFSMLDGLARAQFASPVEQGPMSPRSTNTMGSTMGSTMGPATMGSGAKLAEMLAAGPPGRSSNPGPTKLSLPMPPPPPKPGVPKPPAPISGPPGAPGAPGRPGGPPPPPPPPGLGKGGIAAALRAQRETKLKRSARMGTLYRGLKGKVDGAAAGNLDKLGNVLDDGNKENHGPRLPKGAGAKEAGMADALAEITRKSAYFRQIEDDVTQHAPSIWEAKAALEAFHTDDMAELVKFHKKLEVRLESLTDEGQVLARFEGFPSKKLEIVRQAASLYNRLNSMAHDAETWQVTGLASEQLDRITKHFDRMKKEVEAVERTKEEDERRFAGHKIVFNFSVIARVKEGMVGLSSRFMGHAIKESRKLRGSVTLDREGKIPPIDMPRVKASLQMLWRAFQLAFRIYTFAGGQDDTAEQLSCAIAEEMESYPPYVWAP